VSPDRRRYGDEQAAFLHALRTGDPPPPGFAADDLAAASQSLIRKRARQVAADWPALVHALGPGYDEMFEGFARTTPPPVEGEGLADGFAFARQLGPDALTDDARAELLMARAIFTTRSGAARFRRGPFVAGARLREPHRLLLVLRMPGLGYRHVAIRLGS
jgi:hypothetical protein